MLQKVACIMRPSVASLLKITCTFSAIYNRHRHHGLKLSGQFDGTRINRKVSQSLLSLTFKPFSWALSGGLSGWLGLIAMGDIFCYLLASLRTSSLTVSKVLCVNWSSRRAEMSGEIFSFKRLETETKPRRFRHLFMYKKSERESLLRAVTQFPIKNICQRCITHQYKCPIFMQVSVATQLTGN